MPDPGRAMDPFSRVISAIGMGLCRATAAHAVDVDLAIVFAVD